MDVDGCRGDGNRLMSINESALWTAGREGQNDRWLIAIPFEKPMGGSFITGRVWRAEPPRRPARATMRSGTAPSHSAYGFPP